MPFDRQSLPDPITYFESRGLTLIGRGPWRTTACHFHGGSDSLRVDTRSGGWVCMNCGAKGGDVLAYEMASTGLGFVDAAKDLGAWIEDGRPPPKLRATKLSGAQALQAIDAEALLVCVIASDLAKGKVLDGATQARLFEAAAIISHLQGAFL